MLRKVVIGLGLALAWAPAAIAVPELSTSDRLEDRRYAAVGTRAYSVGTEDGRWPAMGFHIRGEMGGIWAPPLKLLDASGSRSTVGRSIPPLASRVAAATSRWPTRRSPGCGWVGLSSPPTAGARC